jgi:anti-sigma factor RsiW
MTDAWRIADLHAYVDDCLEPDERVTFEQHMAQDPALARRAALWRAQNSAIRAAFDTEGAKTFSINVVRRQNEPFGRHGRSTADGGRLPSDEPTQHSLLTIVDASRFSANIAAPEASRSSRLWRAGLAVLAVCLAFVWAPAATVLPAKGLGEGGVAAFQAFSRPGVEPVEFATSDRNEAQAWLTARLTHPVTLPDTPSAIRLVGARIAPYPGSPAAFLVYKSQNRTVSLLIRSFDAPPTIAPQLLAGADGRTAAVWAWRSQGFALVGDLEAASLLKIANDFFDPALDAVQARPDRGW